MKQRILANRHRIVFCLFMAFHTLTCLFTGYYGDDYYYASFLKNGTDFLISENIDHYLFTNGRALVHLLDELLLGWSFHLWRIAAILVMGALVIVTAKLAARSYRPDANPELYKSAIVAVCALFAVTDIAVLRQSVYWATGALNYLFPAALTMWLIYRLRRDFYRDTPDRWLPVIALLAAVTTEQASAAALLAVLYTIFLAMVQKRRIRRVWILSTILAAIGLATILLAPGSAARTEFYPDFYAMPFFTRLLANIPILAAVVLGLNGIYSLMIALMLLTAHRLWKYRPILALIPISGIVVYTYGVTKRPEILAAWWFLALLIPTLAAAFVYVFVGFVKRGEADNLFFLWGGAAIQAAMLLSPEFGPRTLTMTLCLFLVPIARAFIEAKSPFLNGAAAICVIAILPGDMPAPAQFFLLLAIGFGAAMVLFSKSRHLFAVAAVTASLALFATVPAGYAENLPAHAANRAAIEAYDPAENTPLVLYYLPNDIYRYTMPYDNLYHQYALLRLCGWADETLVFYEILP